MQRHFWLAAYDIADPKRRGRALQLLRGFSTGGQKSFLECYLTAAEQRRVLWEMRNILDPTEDRFVLIGLDPRSRVVSLGLAEPPQPGPFVIGA